MMTGQHTEKTLFKSRIKAIKKFLGDDYASVCGSIADEARKWYSAPGNKGKWFVARDFINKGNWPQPLMRLRDRHAGKAGRAVFRMAGHDVGYLLNRVLRDDTDNMFDSHRRNGNSPWAYRLM